MKFLYSSFLCLLVSTSFLQSANPDQQKQKQLTSSQQIMIILCLVGFYGIVLSSVCCKGWSTFKDDKTCWKFDLMGMPTQSVKYYCQGGNILMVAGAISAFVVATSMIAKKKCCKGNKSFD